MRIFIKTRGFGVNSHKSGMDALICSLGECDSVSQLAQQFGPADATSWRVWPTLNVGQDMKIQKLTEASFWFRKNYRPKWIALALDNEFLEDDPKKSKSTRFFFRSIHFGHNCHCCLHSHWAWLFFLFGGNLISDAQQGGPAEAALAPR